MRIHANTLTDADVYAAARLARVELATFTRHGSRSRDHAYEIKLTGESRRRPNGGSYDNEYAATWDQWGVFLAALFNADASIKCWAYDGAFDFHQRTMYRFEDGWPADAHGDHTFRYNGTPYQQECTKCSAIQRWEPRAA